MATFNPEDFEAAAAELSATGFESAPVSDADLARNVQRRAVAGASGEDVLDPGQRAVAAFKFGGIFSPGGVDYLKQTTGRRVLPVTDREGNIDDVLLEDEQGKLRSVAQARDWPGFFSEFGPDVLRAGGSIGGAALGGGVGSVVPVAGTTAGAIGGAMAGVAGAETVIQGIGALLPGDEQASALDRVKQGGFNVALEGVMPVAGGVAKWGGRKVIQGVGVPLRESAERAASRVFSMSDEEALARRAAAERAGVDMLTPGQQSGLSDVLQVEEAIRMSPAGQQIAESGFREQQEQLARTVEARLAKVGDAGGSAAMEEVAKTFRAGRDAIERTGKKRASELFEQARKVSQGRNPFDLENFRSAVASEVKRRVRPGRLKGGPRKFAEELQELVGELPDAVDAGEFQEVMRDIGERVAAYKGRAGKETEYSMAKRLFASLYDDLDTVAEKVDPRLPEANLLKEARRVFRETQEKLAGVDASALNKAFKNAGIGTEGIGDDLLLNPDKAAKKLLSTQEAVTNKRLVSLMNEIDGGPQALQEIKASMLQETLRGKDLADGALNLTSWAKDIRKKRGAWAALLNKEENELLNDVLKTVQTINQRSGVGKQGARTAGILKVFASIGGLRSKAYRMIPVLGESMGAVLADANDEKTTKFIAEAMFNERTRTELQNTFAEAVKSPTRAAIKAFERNFALLFARATETDPESEPAAAAEEQRQFFEQNTVTPGPGPTVAPRPRTGAAPRINPKALQQPQKSSSLKDLLAP